MFQLFVNKYFILTIRLMVAIHTMLQLSLNVHGTYSRIYTAIRLLVHWPLMGKLLHLVQRGEAAIDHLLLISLRIKN